MMSRLCSYWMRRRSLSSIRGDAFTHHTHEVYKQSICSGVFVPYEPLDVLSTYLSLCILACLSLVCMYVSCLFDSLSVNLLYVCLSSVCLSPVALFVYLTPACLSTSCLSMSMGWDRNLQYYENNEETQRELG
jgi:hypothetical protein